MKRKNIYIMEDIDKLYKLYESDNFELMWQLSKSLNINGGKLIRLLYKKYKTDTEDLSFNKLNKRCHLFYYRSDNYYAVIVSSFSRGELTFNEAIELMVKLLDNE